MDRREECQKVEKILPQIVLEECKHYLSDMEKYAKYKNYAVKLDGKTIGWVANVQETTHRMAGRLIARTFKKKSWDYESPEIRRHSGLTYSSRKRAIEELISHLVRSGKL